MANYRLAAGLILLFATSVFAGPKKEPKGQRVPTPQRVAELQKALTDNGYLAGKTWAETQQIMRLIADEHGWQTDFAPDARVLGLIGKGGPHFDAYVLALPPNHLDELQRHEAARMGKADYPLCKVENCTRIIVAAAK